MAQIVSDDFNRANLGNLGANWTNNAGANFGIVSNQASNAAGDANVVYTGAGWTGGNDHYCEAQIITKASGKDASTVARFASAAQTGYFFEINSPDAAVALGSSMTCQMYRVVAAAFTTVGSSAAFTISSADTIRIEAQGTTLTAKLNGVTKLGPSTDSGIASGKPGLNGGNTPGAGDVVFDNFAAGDFTTVSAGIPLLRPATMRFRGSLGALLMGRIAARVFPDVINTGSIGTLSGSAIATAVTSGAVTGKGAVIGAAVARATPTGTLTGTGAITGTTTARAVVAGTGTTLNPISGATIATALTAGTVTGKAALVGAANAAAIATGALVAKGALAGASVVTVVASGATTGKGALSGQAIGTAITTGTVSSAAANLAGAAVCTAIAAGAVTGKAALAGQSICRTTVTGTSSVAASPISGAAVCAVVARGTVAGVGTILGSTNATATVSGALQSKGALAGSAVITCQAIGFVANIPTPNISGAAVCRVDVSGLFVDAPLVPQNQPTGGRGFRSAPRWWKDKPTPQHIVGHGVFTLPGNSMAGRGAIEFRGRGAFDLLPFTHNGQAEQSFGAVGEFELDHMGIRMWAQVENKVYATALASPEMSAVCTVSMDDREEEEIIIKLLYEN